MNDASAIIMLEDVTETLPMVVPSGKDNTLILDSKLEEDISMSASFLKENDADLSKDPTPF